MADNTGVMVLARGHPACAGLDLERYLPVPDSLNPMLRVSFDFHWNKPTLISDSLG